MENSSPQSSPAVIIQNFSAANKIRSLQPFVFFDYAETLLLLYLTSPRRGSSLFFPPSQPKMTNAVLRLHPKGAFFTD